MRGYLMLAGWMIWTPAAVGVTARYVVDGYRGEASWMLWTGIGLMLAAMAWGFAERRLAKAEPIPEPRKFTIYDWTEEGDGVRFHARYDDGEEIEFVHSRGMTGTRAEAA